MRFTFEVQGQAQFDRAFSRAGEHLSDLRPVWDGLEKTFYRIASEQFKSEGAKGRSGKWKELSPEYEKRKAIDYPGTQILYRTGRLERSLTGNTADSVLIKERQEFGYGTSLFYAAYHQSGTGKMPQREVISLSDQSRTDITKDIQKNLLRILKADRSVTQSIEVE